MTDLPAILSGVALALAAIAFWLSVQGLALKDELKEHKRGVSGCMNEVSDLKNATNEATAKTAETVSRLVADVQHLKQDVAKLHNTARSIPDNDLPGVPRSSPFRRP